MSADRIRTVLDNLFENPDDAAAWEQLEEVVTGDEGTDPVAELERARLQHEHVGVWFAVARLLDLEVQLAKSDDEAGAKQLVWGTVLDERLYQPKEAGEVFAALDDVEEASEALARIGETAESWLEDVAALESEAAQSEGAERAGHLAEAAEVLLSFGPRDEAAYEKSEQLAQQSIDADSDLLDAWELLQRNYEEREEWEALARLLADKCARVSDKAAKVSAAHRAAQIARHKVDDDEAAVQAYSALLDLQPDNGLAFRFLSEHFSENEDWHHLIGLYEDQLKGGALAPESEFGLLVQLAMLNWKTLSKPDAAEPYFSQVQLQEPTHAGMLHFFRSYLRKKGDTSRFIKMLEGAIDATDDDDKINEWGDEIDDLRSQIEEAQKLIDRYKKELRQDPDDGELREKLKSLYMQTEAYTPLVELLRQDLQRLDDDDSEARIALLRQIAAVYRDRAQSNTALLTVLTQIVQIDEGDVDAVRGLIQVYESLSRWRDLLNMQRKLARLTDNHVEKVSLLRAVARRWTEQFSNVQNAIASYEELMTAEPEDVEAQEKLRELYKKRRAWPKLYVLYEKQLGTYADPSRAAAPERLELMQRMAKLAAERLNRGVDAIKLLREVLEIDASAEGVLSQLERQAERSKDYATVAFVLESRIAEAAGDKQRLQLLQKLGTLQADKIGDSAAAKAAWRRVLDVSPGHKRALRVLRQSYVADADWDGLEELYVSQDDSDGLADFLSTTADRSKDEDQKLELSFRAAHVYAELLDSPERAIRSYERILSVDESNTKAVRALLPLYERDEKWTRLPGLYLALLEEEEEVDEKIRILHKVADITGGPLANKAGALGYARRAYELRPDDDGLRALQEWSQQSGEWAVFIEVLSAKLESDEATAPQVRDWRRLLAEVYAHDMGKLDEAVAMYRQLVEAEPDDQETIATLEQILRSADRRDDLRWLFDFKVENSAGEARSAALEDWATIEEEVFGEPERARDLLAQVIEADPSRTVALAGLARLSLASKDWEGAKAALVAQRDASSDDARAQIELQLANLALEQLAKPAESLEACLRALELTPHSDEAAVLLETLLEQGETRFDAATALEQLYANSGRHEDRIKALRAMLEFAEEVSERIALCVRLIDVYEVDLDDPVSAFEVALNALSERSEDAELWDRAEALSKAAGNPTDLAQAYHQHLLVADDDGEAKTSEGLRIVLAERAASLQSGQLGDPDGAIPFLQLILDADPSNEEAFEALKSVLNSVERWDELEELYASAIEGEEDSAQKIELLHQVALVAEEMLGQDGSAITYYEGIIELDSIHPEAVEALERLYARGEHYERLAELLENKLLTAAGDETREIQLQLIELYLQSEKRSAKALPHVEATLHLPDVDGDARGLAERCLDDDSLRLPVAALLDGIYEERDEIRDLVRILDIRYAGEADDNVRRELLRRLATLRDERLKDDEGAFKALCGLVPLEPEDETLRERFRSVGLRLAQYKPMSEALLEAAAAAEEHDIKAEILLECAAIMRDRLDATVRAESVYREVIELDVDDSELRARAAEELGSLYDERGDHAELAAVLALKVEFVDDPDERGALLERVAVLYDDILEQPSEAILAWQQRLEDVPGDAASLNALERLYEQIEKWSELAEVLRQLEQEAEDGDERKRCMVRLAEVLSSHSDEQDEAVVAWRAVLDDFGPESSVLAPLRSLYEAMERWEDLAEVHETWLGLDLDSSKRIELLASLSELQAQHLGDAHSALAGYREVLTLDPEHSGARNALELLLEDDDDEVRREAAEIIGPLYEADGDAERTLKVLNIEIDSTYDLVAKLSLLQRALNTAEDILEKPALAYDYAVRAVRDALGEPDIEDWLGTAQRLAAASERWEDLLDLLEAVTEDILDAEVQQQMRLRAGEIARGTLDDGQRAIRHYRAALDERPDEEDALLALEELYAEADQAPDLHEVLVLRSEATESDDDRVELLFRIAQLRAEKLDNQDGAIEAYEDLLQVRLEPEAVKSLDGLYRKTEQFEQVISLQERLLDEASDSEAADIHVVIAEVAHKRLDDINRSLDELAEALGFDEMHGKAVAVLESLLQEAEEPDHKGQIAEMLEPVYLRQANWSKLKAALEARLENTVDPEDRVDLLARLATLYEEQLEDYPAALETVAKRLQEEPGDAPTWSEIERLGRVIGAESERRIAEIFAQALRDVGADDPSTAALAERTGELFAAVGETESALTWYRRAYEFNRESRELFQAIDELLIELEAHGDRVEHYRAALDEIFEDEKRVSYLHTVASLQRENLEQSEEAINTYREICDIDEQNAVALDGLTELYKKSDARSDLAELYEGRAEREAQPEQAAEYRLALANLLASDELERDRSIDQLELVLTEIPWHEAATKALESLVDDEEVQQRVIELLQPVYERGENWKGIVRLKELAFLRADGEAEQVEILTDIAMVYEDQVDDAEAAFSVTKRAFLLLPESDDSRSALERLAEVVGLWSEVADCYQDLAANNDDEFLRAQLLDSLALICDERLDDPRRSLAALSGLFELEPEREGVAQRLDELCVLLGDWSLLAEVVRYQADNDFDDAAKVASLHRLGGLLSTMLGETDKAIGAFEEAVDIDQEATPSLDSLIDLYQGKDAQRQVELLEQRATATREDDELRFDLMFQAAEVYETQLDDNDAAIRLLQELLDELPTDLDMLRTAERLYRAESLHSDLLENLEAQASLAADGETRVALRNKMGDIYLAEFDNAYDAFGQYRLAVDEDEEDQHALAAVRRIGEEYEEHRQEVSILLEPVLSRAGKFRELCEILELRVSAQDDSSLQAETLVGIAFIQEEQLDAPAEALATVLRALKLTPADWEVHGNAERLCGLSADYSSYVDVLEACVDDIFEADVRCRLLERVGELAERELKQPDRAIAAYSQAAEQSEAPSYILESLDRLYLATEKFDELAEVLERRIDLSDNDSEQADLQWRLGAVRADHFEDIDTALQCYQLCIDLNPEHDGAQAALEKLVDDEERFEFVAETLETIYRVKQDSAARARLRSKRISYTPEADERIRLRLELASMLEDESFDTVSAQEVVQDALSDGPSNGAVMAELQRLAEVNAAGDMGKSAWRSAAEAIEVALQGTPESGSGLQGEAACEVMLVAAGWCSERAEDAEAAERLVREALRFDPVNAAAVMELEKLHRAPERESELVATLRKMAALAQDGAALDREPIAFWREAHALASEALQSEKLSEAILREVLAADDASLWALGELADLCEAKKEYQELYALQRRQLELVVEAETIRELRHRAAKVVAEQLDDMDAAIDLYEEAFEDDPNDEAASGSLRRIYSDLERHEDMLRLAERLIDLSEDEAERAELRFASATLCIEKLSAPTEGIEYLKTVLEEVPGHEKSVLLLSEMLEREGRYDEFAELLEQQIDYARKQKEEQAELNFRVRLSELFETRLNDPARAITGYLGVLENAPTFKPALEALARLYESEEEWAEAAATYEKLLAMAPDEAKTQLALKVRKLFMSGGDDEAACRPLEILLKEHAEALDAAHIEQLRDALRGLYKQLERWEPLALLITDEAEEAEEVNVRLALYRQAAQIYSEQAGNHGAAAVLLEQALELKQEDRDLMLSLCDEYTASGRGNDAIEILERVVKTYKRRSKELADVHFRIATAYLAEEQPAEALVQLESARKMDPGNIMVLKQLGQLLIQVVDDGEDPKIRGELIKRASGVFRALLLQRLSSTSPISKAEVFYWLAEVNIRDDDKKKAMHNLERALSNDKSLEKAQNRLDELRGK